MAAAGYAAGNGPTIKLEYSMSYPEEGALAEAMQPMLNAVGFKAVVERVDIAERNRRRNTGNHVNTLLFFGPGGRLTALAGAYSVWGPDQNWGPKHDKDVVAALRRASSAASLDEYTEAMADLGELIHERAYGPGFFSAGALFFIRKGIADWGLERSQGRGLAQPRRAGDPALEQVGNAGIGRCLGLNFRLIDPATLRASRPSRILPSPVAGEDNSVPGLR